MHTISRLLEVNVGITQGSAGDHVSADSNWQDRSCSGEFFKEHGLCDILMKVADVERRHRVVRTSRTGIHLAFLRVALKFKRRKGNCRESEAYFHFRYKENGCPDHVAQRKHTHELGIFTPLKRTFTHYFFVILIIFWIFFVFLCFFKKISLNNN